MAETLLEQAKAPIWCEFGVADNEEGEVDLVIESNHHPPYQIMEHGIVLVLPHAVVGMQVYV